MVVTLVSFDTFQNQDVWDLNDKILCDEQSLQLSITAHYVKLFCGGWERRGILTQDELWPAFWTLFGALTNAIAYSIYESNIQYIEHVKITGKQLSIC